MGQADPIISILGWAYAESIVTLYEALENSEPQGANDLKASNRENGYSVSIIVLSVLALESCLNRLKHVKKHPARPAGWEYFNTYHAASGLVDECAELFVIRDIIAHNHVWEAEADRETLSVIRTVLSSGYGDSKYRQAVDSTTRRTRKLTLNAFPLRIHMEDVKIVLHTVRQIFDYLKGIDPSSDPARVIVRYKRKVIHLSDFLAQF